ncbi:MAG: ChaN family lipoprotein [Phycisphaerales bacterium]|nr:ChaN family lipoprotein [Phycisphaerales bacterium]
MPHLPIVLTGMFLLVSLAGCHTPASPKVDEREGPARAMLGSPEARSVPMLDGQGGVAVPWSEIVSRARSADVVLIGELHGHPLGSAAAAALWEDVLASPGVAARASLSMEFFERDEQALLDDYLTGLIDEPRLLKAGNKDSYLAYPFGQRVMVNEARAHGVPVVAANAPRIYVRTARLEGYERLRGLTEEQRRMFRIPDRLPGPESGYRRKFQEFMLGAGGHGGESGDQPASSPSASAPTAEDLARVEAGFRSQSLWDWTMAESVSREFGRGRRPVVHVVGQFHIAREGGLLLALREMAPAARVLTIAVVDAESSSLREEDRGVADVVVYVGGR